MLPIAKKIIENNDCTVDMRWRSGDGPDLKSWFIGYVRSLIPSAVVNSHGNVPVILKMSLC